MAAIETATVQQIEGWAARLGQVKFDFRNALDLCLISIISTVKGRFAGSHGPGGLAWPPLKRPRPNSKGTDRPLRDKNLLMGSLTSRQAPGHYEQITDSRLEYGSNMEYAGTHQYGATITPKTSKYLAIPISKQAYNVGRPRNWNGSELKFRPFKNRGGKAAGVLYEKKTKQQRGGVTLKSAVGHYLLVTSVTVPARPFLGWDDDLLDDVGQILAEQAAKVMLQLPFDPNGGSPRMAA